MKKLIALLLAAVMVLSMFAACSKTPVETNPAETTPAVTPTKEATPENVAPNAEPVYIAENAQELTGEITFYTAFAGENGTDALIAEFNEYYPNVTVNYEVYKNSGDGNVGLDTAMMAGGQVDVILSFGVANTADRWKNGMLMDLTDQIGRAHV